MTDAPDKGALARHTYTSLVSQLVGFAVPLVTTPYIIGRVSFSTYGVWVAMNWLALILSRYDLGLWGAVPRDVAERRARGNLPGLRATAAAWLYFDLLAGALVVAGVAATAGPLLALMVPNEPPGPLRGVLIAFATQAALTPILRHLGGTLQGLQRLDLANRVSLWVMPLSVCGLVAFLETGWGILGLTLNSVLFLVVQIAALAVIVRQLGYPVFPSPGAFRLSELARMVAFGWKLEAAQLLFLAFKSDRFLLSAMGTTPAVVGTYNIGSKVADHLALPVSALSSAILPAASDLAARGDTERIRLLLMRGSRYHGLAAVAILGFAALFGNEIMIFWMGVPLPGAVAVLRIMMAGSYFWVVASCAQAIGVALGRPGRQLVSLAAGVGLTALLYLTVGRRYDYRGLAGAVSTGMALAQICFVLGFRRILAFSWREYVGNTLLRPLCAALPMAAVYGAWLLAAPHLPAVDSRAMALAVLGPVFLLSAASGWFFVRALRVLDDYDLGVLKSALGRARA